MAVNRVAGLALPITPKYLVRRCGRRGTKPDFCRRSCWSLSARRLSRRLTSYSLTQLLSKSSQRMITELRVKVQAHIGRLPVSYYDANKTGVLVSRIMSDVEGVRNLVGTGLVDFAGGIMTAILALGYLLRISVSMTARGFRGRRDFCARTEQSVQDDSPDLSRAAQNQRRGHRPADRIAWRRARGEGLSRRRARRKKFFRAGCRSCSTTCCKH